tara:strand:+ start:51720 stop:52691 length:972 start_codon:yes stop_codon:yes gene_type:complete
MQNILITGITGQDGLFLTSKLLNENKQVKIFGVSREKNNNLFFKKLKTLTNIEDHNITLINLNLENLNKVDFFIKDVMPTHIYNLSGPSSVYKSLNDDYRTYNQITNIFNNLIYSVENNMLNTKFFQASSSEMFGENTNGIFNEHSKLRPSTPYAKAKYLNHIEVIRLFEQKGWDIHSGIMFNHESEFRANEYLFMKIINSAKDIKNNEINNFEVGSLDIERDWTFAGDTADAIFKITNQGNESNYVIGSGKGYKIKDLIEIVFNYFDLRFEEYLIVNEDLNRKENLIKVVSSPNRIKKELSWEATLGFKDLVIRCIEKKYYE